MAIKRDSKGRKYCPGCDSWKEEGEYHKNSHNGDGLQTYCKECQIESVAESRRDKETYDQSRRSARVG